MKKAARKPSHRPWGGRKNAGNKDEKLANQIGKIVMFVLIGVFSVLIIITVLLTSTSLSEAIDDTVTSMSKSTAQQVQTIVDMAKTTANNIESYLQKAYSYDEKGYSNMAGQSVMQGENRKYESSIYPGTEINELNADVEKYMTETARNTVMNNEAIEGMGAMFEPYKYDPNIESYAFYVDESVGADGEIEPWGEYQEYSKEAYYQEAYKTKTAVFTDPYEYEGKMLITYAVPVLYNDEVQGVVMADINTENFSEAVALNDDYPSMYTTLYNDKYVDMFDSETAEDVGRLMDEFFKNQNELKAVKEEIAKGQAFYYETTREDGRKVARYFTPFQAGDKTWWSMTALDKSEKNEATVKTVVILLIVSIVSLCVIVATVIRILRSKIKPIEEVVRAAQSISQGNLDIDIQARSNDEIGKLAGAFHTTVEGLKTIIGDVNYLLKEMADGNFAVKTGAEASYKGDFEAILTSIRSLNKTLNETMLKISEASDQVAAGSGNLADASQSLAEGATEQAGAVEELLATITNLTEGIEHTADQVGDAYGMAQKYADKANDGSTEMQRLVEIMGRISETSKQVGSIIQEIEEIASQTNLLSLNASIEAARAGEAGRGFAVVADQIGKLADESAKSAVNTRSLIMSAISEIETGSQAVTNTAGILEEVVTGISQVAESSREVSDLSKTQAEAMKQAEAGVNQISEVVQANSATAEESSATSQELSAEAVSLDELVKRFRLVRDDQA